MEELTSPSVTSKSGLIDSELWPAPVCHCVDWEKAHTDFRWSPLLLRQSAVFSTSWYKSPPTSSLQSSKFRKRTVLIEYRLGRFFQFRFQSHCQFSLSYGDKNRHAQFQSELEYTNRLYFSAGNEILTGSIVCAPPGLWSVNGDRLTNISGDKMSSNGCSGKPVQWPAWPCTLAGQKKTKEFIDLHFWALGSVRCRWREICLILRHIVAMVPCSC